MEKIHGRNVFDSLGEVVDPKHTAVLVIDMQNDFIDRTFGDREDEGAFEKGAFAVQGTSEEPPGRFWHAPNAPRRRRYSNRQCGKSGLEMPPCRRGQ